MPRLLVTERAIADVDDIADYIARDKLDVALRFYDEAAATFDLLASTPGAGPRFDPPLENNPELRFWPIRRFRNYLVIYRPKAEGVEILRVVHGARDLRRELRQA